MGIIHPPTIVPYRGYGTSAKVYLKGQVLENRPAFISNEDDKKRRNLKHMLARYLSTVIPEAKVEISFRGKKAMAETDESGYFSTWLEMEEGNQEYGWQTVEYRLLEGEYTKEVIKTGKALIVNPSARYGVISDIDDTILVSHATQILRKLRLILIKNAKTRLPFEGVKKFYDRLAGNGKSNPIFYVSSSEWNLYDFLVDFFSTRQLPKGPFLLQNFKSSLLDLIRSGGGSHQHKIDKIDRLMSLFPDLKFVLIGDSGQRDPEIYAHAARHYSDRVLAVFIRSVGRKKELDEELVSETLSLGVPMLLVEDTEEAYDHATSAGLFTN
ncbi:App1 family protein [Reichenbachiella ulvae]|uniref:DUF2183 domain-containing protein n=1 Tax=Reichenbachiella ulvae TaxID=2980104 RepID=A0ABT3CWD9_9BACT|nr:phosphatase domain-containing protein [Reichenbachiella ulvae]MCV9387834.1 DUF2183 domain-containing protein [Reichenbachiella ulvae]